MRDKPEMAGLPLPQIGGGVGTYGQPQAGSPSTPGPGGGTAGGGASSTLGAAGGGASGSGTGTAGGAGAVGLGVTGGTTGGGAGGGAAGGGSAANNATVTTTGQNRRGRGWGHWHRGDPSLMRGLWKSKGPLDSLGNAEAYIFLALTIGFVTVVVGCWLSDNCWSPEPEGVVTLA
ncbi:uncharacterized protein LOC117217662 [Megalopta genalis]|uniref:uncharacterized protein LOC117217662 n=1 Tax=Megalopta genalis TaxID=115081 RepID=UPI0014436045|nr:keratin, type II cytoskeletal 2 epidermal-like [Megalopta genalis]